MAWLLSLVFVLDAHAALVVARYCVDYSGLDYIDRLTGDIHTGTTMKAWDALLRFEPNTGGQFGYYLDGQNGADPGCRTLSLDNTKTYTVKLIREAAIEGNLLQVKNASGLLYATTLKTNHVPVQGANYAETASGDSVLVMAAATRAISRRDGGLTGETFEVRLDACGTGGNGSCYLPAQHRVHIDSSIDHHRYKFLIAHEVGHMLADAKNGWLGNNQDYDAAPDGCPSSTPTVLHDFPYKEFNSGAAVEGFAHFYSAMAFNEDTSPGADCEVQKHYDVDWDRSGVRGDTFADTDTFSCEGGFDAWDPPPVNQYVQQADNFDYLGDHCLASGQSNNRGTTYDWMRMFWDLRTDEGVTPDVIFAIWAEADPDDWNATGNGTGAGYPAFRMSVAAYDVGGSALQLKYNAVAPDNGTTR